MFKPARTVDAGSGVQCIGTFKSIRFFYIAQLTTVDMIYKKDKRANKNNTHTKWDRKCGRVWGRGRRGQETAKPSQTKLELLSIQSKSSVCCL